MCAAPLAAQDIPEKKRTNAGLYLDVSQAVEMLQDPEVVFVDVRSRAEVAFLGLPTRVNVHIPYMQAPMMPEYDAKKHTYNLELNPDFSLDFKAYAEANGVDAETPIVLMCRSGSRSALAANLLAELGYKQVYSLIEGYEGDKAKEGPQKGQRVVNGWKNAGMEWSYSISESQVYPADKM
ncbi:MAG: rhodanese-like domain-containing protein [Paracoccaceae bacterium]